MKKICVTAVFLMSILMSGCSEAFTNTNPIAEMLMTSSYKASGIMTVGSKSYNLNLSHTPELDTMSITSENINTAIVYKLDSQNLTISNNGENEVIMPIGEMTSKSLPHIIFDSLDKMANSTATSEKESFSLSSLFNKDNSETEDPLKVHELILQDVGILTADKDKNLTSLTLPSKEIVITFNEFALA